MNKPILLTLLFLVSIKTSSQNNPMQSPGWVKDLIIYEIATKGFTSPNGPESGTFNSLKEKIPYLRDLGITGVWLTGHHLCAPRFFYHCWNQYAVIRPDSIDPSLGTEEDFKALVEEFHKNGIKVFLDVITHGVMNSSSLIAEHPGWFRGGSWGMTDYDWQGSHADLDEWWVDMYTNYVTTFGVDGYRLDVDIYRPDLWKRIKENCTKAGHPIAVWSESDIYTDGACDFLQRQAAVSIQTQGVDTNSYLATDVPRYFIQRSNRSKYYQAEVHYSDNSAQYGSTDNDAVHIHYGPPYISPDPEYIKNPLRVTLIYDPAIQPSNEKYKADEESDYIQLKIENLNPQKRITWFSVRTVGYWTTNWQFGSPNEWYTLLGGIENTILYLKPFVPDIKYYSIQLSCHDDGWDGFPENGNPYVAEGSRCIFGYSFLFTPAIPVFFAGEEFSAAYKPVPNLTPDLFGQKKEGTGRWLYGSWIQWDQLQQKEHSQMLEDVKKMIRIRKENSDLFFAWTDDKMPDMISLEFQSEIKIPTPYLVWNNKKIIIIAGNNTDRDVACTVHIPLEKSGLEPGKTYKVHDLWNEKTMDVKGSELANLQVRIKRDHIPSGGISVIAIEK